jgi:glutathione S-transferase
MTQANVITLYGFGPRFDLPEASPYVTKTEVHLKMMGLAYRKDLTGFPAAPKGKLPYIDDEGERVADSTFIRRHLERKHGVDLDEGLDARRRAEAWAVERLLEDHLGWAMAYFRWLVPENFAKGPAHFFDAVPEPMREKARADAQQRVRDNHHAHGLGRHSIGEITELAGRSLEAVAAILGDGPFLMGERLSAVDATCFGMLAGILTPFFDSPLRREAERYPGLAAYVARMMARYYPEHAWT